MSEMHKGYVNYLGRRYSIVSWWQTEEDKIFMYRLRAPNVPDVAVQSTACIPWKRASGMRHIKGKALHREKRPVHLDIDTGAEIIKARLKGKRLGFTCTFGGLYDLLARQQVINAKRDRAWEKRTGKKLTKKNT